MYKAVLWTYICMYKEVLWTYIWMYKEVLWTVLDIEMQFDIHYLYINWYIILYMRHKSHYFIWVLWIHSTTDYNGNLWGLNYWPRLIPVLGVSGIDLYQDVLRISFSLMLLPKLLSMSPFLLLKTATTWKSNKSKLSCRTVAL